MAEQALGTLNLSWTFATLRTGIKGDLKDPADLIASADLIALAEMQKRDKS